ncbi:hypothetical protein BDK51DRAFT_31081 [Blyttiomyces helicus]|uniref:Uncharacterized protein n=1 Tax=Blyttiomyces helicus TaxID=388810 RepID=A0A4P9WF80_9FUNG|nr:hypothetical protein BDK51DRAFT_31081 [Blyttiomyces helicus]|eukprot:RKO91284.1 hypothetical protein BDK51DRAFT_31081 [Blyttiomyces helicus]
MLIPFYDHDNAMLYLAGKGDGNIRYYEWVDDEKGLYHLSDYNSADPQRGIGFLPKRSVIVAECEIARAYKVTPTRIEHVSFRVPRKFDLFLDCAGPESSLTVDEFFAWKTSEPKLVSLESRFTRSAPKAHVTSTTLESYMDSASHDPASASSPATAVHETAASSHVTAVLKTGDSDDALDPASPSSPAPSSLSSLDCGAVAPASTEPDPPTPSSPSVTPISNQTLRMLELGSLLEKVFPNMGKARPNPNHPSIQSNTYLSRSSKANLTLANRVAKLLGGGGRGRCVLLHHREGEICGAGPRDTEAISKVMSDACDEIRAWLFATCDTECFRRKFDKFLGKLRQDFLDKAWTSKDEEALGLTGRQFRSMRKLYPTKTHFAVCVTKRTFSACALTLKTIRYREASMRVYVTASHVKVYALWRDCFGCEDVTLAAYEQGLNDYKEREAVRVLDSEGGSGDEEEGEAFCEHDDVVTVVQEMLATEPSRDASI